MGTPKYKVIDPDKNGEVVRTFKSLEAARIFIRNTLFCIKYNKSARLLYAADMNDRPSYLLARPTEE